MPALKKCLSRSVFGADASLLGGLPSRRLRLLSRGVAVENVADLTAGQFQLFIAQRVEIRVTEVWFLDFLASLVAKALNSLR